MSSSNQNGSGGSLGLVILLIIGTLAMILLYAILLLLAPGAVITAIAFSIFGMSPDLGQAWVFAVVLSGGIFLAYWRFFEKIVPAQRAYAFTCAVIGLIYLVSGVGFHANWAIRHFSYFLPIVGKQ